MSSLKNFAAMFLVAVFVICFTSVSVFAAEYVTAPGYVSKNSNVGGEVVSKYVPPRITLTVEEGMEVETFYPGEVIFETPSPKIETPAPAPAGNLQNSVTPGKNIPTVQNSVPAPGSGSVYQKNQPSVEISNDFIKVNPIGNVPQVNLENEKTEPTKNIGSVYVAPTKNPAPEISGNSATVPQVTPVVYSTPKITLTVEGGIEVETFYPAGYHV